MGEQGDSEFVLTIFVGLSHLHGSETPQGESWTALHTQKRRGGVGLASFEAAIKTQRTNMRCNGSRKPMMNTFARGVSGLINVGQHLLGWYYTRGLGGERGRLVWLNRQRM